MDGQRLVDMVAQALNDRGLGPGQFSNEQILDAINKAAFDIAESLELTVVVHTLPIANNTIALPEGIMRIIKVQ